MDYSRYQCFEMTREGAVLVVSFSLCYGAVCKTMRAAIDIE